MFPDSGLPSIVWSQLTTQHQIGKGRFGTINLGTLQNPAAQTVLIEELEASLLSLPNVSEELEVKSRERFKQNHPNIIRLLGIASEPGRFALIFEHQNNMLSLRSKLDKLESYLPWNIRWQIALDVANGLAYIHGLGALHKDLNSMHILVHADSSQPPNAKITDFPFGKTRSLAGFDALNPEKSGSRWQAPEALDGQPNSSMDVYSYGMILWELASLVRPFAPVLNDNIVFSMIRTGARELIPADCPERYAEVIRQCWQEQPEMRPSMPVIHGILQGARPSDSEFADLVPKPWDSTPVHCTARSVQEHYSIFPAGPTDTERVLQEYNRSPVPGYTISKIEIIDNKQLRRAFANRTRILNTRAQQPQFQPKWRYSSAARSPIISQLQLQIQQLQQSQQASAQNTQNQLLQLQQQLQREIFTHQSQIADRQRVDEKHKKSAESYRDPESPHVRIAPAWHGTPKENISGICDTGYATLGVHGRLYGSGNYFGDDPTHPYIDYAKGKSSDPGKLIFTITASYAAYPALPVDVQNLQDKGPFENYDAHIVPVKPDTQGREKRPGVPHYVICPPAEAKYFQWVFFESASTLPLYLVTLRPIDEPLLPLPNEGSYYEGIKEYINCKYTAAKLCFEKAAEQQYPAAYLWLSILYIDNLVPIENPIEISQWLQKTALEITWFSQQILNDTVEAHLNLGLCYYYGVGVTKNLASATRYFIHAAAKGDVVAQTKLGDIYKAKNNIADMRSAFNHYLNAARKAYAVAQKSLGDFYYRGEPKLSITKDLSRAFDYYLYAAQNGYAEAQYILARCYEQNQGVDKDLKQAFTWYVKAAENNHRLAQYEVGEYYFYKGPQKNEPQANNLAAEWYLKAAKNGVNDAQYRIGWYHSIGIGGIEQDFSKAYQWYIKAAAQHHPSAEYELGECYEYGKGLEANMFYAIYWYQRAAANKNAKALCKLGELYEQGKVPNKNILDAVALYEQAGTNSFNNDAKYKLAQCYASGKIPGKTFIDAIPLYEAAATQNHAHAQYQLAQYYQQGKIEGKTVADAIDLYQKAAIQNYAPAQYELAEYYAQEKIPGKTLVDAIPLYEEAAKQKHAPVQYKLAQRYASGKIPGKTLADAIPLYEEAAKQNYAPAQYELGVRYSQGNGMPVNKLLAADLFRKAAEQGLAEAQYNLGVCYELGKGVQENKTTAFEWYQKAADQNHAEAIYSLGLYYVINNTPQSLIQAVQYFEKAAKLESFDAKCCMVLCYEQGKGVAQNPFQALTWAQRFLEPMPNATLLEETINRIKNLLDHTWEAKLLLRTYRANCNKPRSQFSLAACYGQQDNDEAKKLAFSWYQKAANNNNINAQYALGDCYQYGKGTAVDDLQAFYWYQKAADQGYAQALYCLGLCHENSIGIQSNITNAIKYYEQAANKNIPEALHHLGLCYYQGRNGINADINKALSFLKKAAELNHIDAKYQLACHYFTKKSSADEEKCFTYFQELANNNYKDSTYYCAQCFEVGYGPTVDIDKAIELYKKAIESSPIPAYLSLANIYERGRAGVRRNPNLARGYYQQAANLGDAVAQAKINSWPN